MFPGLASDSGRKHLGGGGRKMGLRDRTSPCLLPLSSPSKKLSPKLNLVCLLTSGGHVLPSQGLLPRSIYYLCRGNKLPSPFITEVWPFPGWPHLPWVPWVSGPPVLGWRCSCLSNSTPPPLSPLWRILGNHSSTESQGSP